MTPSISILVPALFFIAIAVTTLVYITRLVIRSCGWDLNSLKGALHPRTWRLKREKRLFTAAAGQIPEVDRLINEGSYSSAVSLLRNTLLLQDFVESLEVMQGLHTHHLKVLSRLVDVADALGVRIERLGVCEDLLQNRALCLVQRYESSTIRRKLQEKHGSQGRGEWADKEYQRKVADLEDQLKTNLNAINKELELLISQLQQGKASKDSMTVH